MDYTNKTAAQINIAERKYTKAANEWDTYQDCQAVNQELILRAVDHDFLREVEHIFAQWVNVSCRDLISH